jgi:4-diphosphocytidyl-2-C-methyl-D-erythritol kinase
VTAAGGTYPAPAKLNLMLRVVGRRPDGYHLLQTVFRFIDYGDAVSLTVRADGMIRRTADLPGIPADDDLTVRAAQLLQQECGTRLGVDIAVAKRLPAGGGLGGGSSDAGTTLVALNHLWRAGLGREGLMRLATRLGADVPVFVFGDNALGEGIGERLTRLDLPPAWYVVLTPPVAVATALVFGHPELKRDSKMITIQSFSAELAGNDLEPLVRREYPEVAQYLTWLGRHGRALMTGSGSSVFAAYDDEHAARAVLAQLPSTMRGFVARGLDRHPLRDLVA